MASFVWENWPNRVGSLRSWTQGILPGHELILNLTKSHWRRSLPACLPAVVWETISNTVQGIAAALYRNTLPHMSAVRGKTGVEKVKSLSKKPHIYETSQSLSLQFVWKTSESIIVLFSDNVTTPCTNGDSIKPYLSHLDHNNLTANINHVLDAALHYFSTTKRKQHSPLKLSRKQSFSQSGPSKLFCLISMAILHDY